MPFPEPWRTRLRPASYGGVPFLVEIEPRSSGRRTVPHEFPKKDIGWTEDMGRRLRRFQITAYVVQGPDNGYDYTIDRDALIEVLEAEGPGQLVHPTYTDIDLVMPDTYTVTERRDRGGYAEIEMVFIEAGAQPSTSLTPDTQTNVTNAAQSAITDFQNSPDLQFQDD